MTDFLQYLNDLTEPEILSPECIEKIKACNPFFNQILALTSIKFLDQFIATLGRVEEEKRQESFSRGFRLGARAMLAALTPPSAERP